MPELHYNDGGTWRKAKELHYNDGGTWRKAKEVWYNDGGTWRKVFSSGAVVNPIPPAYDIDSNVLAPADAISTIHLASDGTVVISAAFVTDTQNWFSPTTAGIGNSYWVRLTVAAGNSPTSGSAVGSWLQLSTSRSWTWSVTSDGGGFLVGTVTIEIATDSSGTNVVASRTGLYVRASVEL